MILFVTTASVAAIVPLKFDINEKKHTNTHIHGLKTTSEDVKKIERKRKNEKDQQQTSNINDCNNGWKHKMRTFWRKAMNNEVMMIMFWF